ncbi:hypothetical protein H5410_050397, partial [Solanum commersonii]
MSTISLVNITEGSPLTPQSHIDLNNPAPSYQPGPFSTMLSDHLFEGDLPQSKSSEYNILAASENLVIESLTQMREWVRNEEGSSFMDGILGDSEQIFDQTPEVGVHPSTDSSDTDEDNISLRWEIQKRMVTVTMKGKEKVTEKTPKKKPFTRVTSQKLMGNAMKSSKTTMAENKKRRRSHQSKKGNHSMFLSKNLNRDLKIVDNLRLHEVLGRRVFNPEIIAKPGMNSLADLVEIQSWTHIFMTKSPFLHEEQVREFYYNIFFSEDGNLNTLFVKECSKFPDMHRAGVQKKLIKREYQLLFEFVNK